MRWFEEHRHAWIKEMMGVYGFVTTSHLMRKFNISKNQAAIDLHEMKHTLKIKYDRELRCFVPSIGARRHDRLRIRKIAP